MTTPRIRFNRRAGASSRRGFTLVELLVAMAVLMLLMGILASIVTQTTDVWRGSTGKLEAFQGARAGFDLVTRTLSQSTLNTVRDYYYQDGFPIHYRRSSDLHFINNPVGGENPGVFFQTYLNRPGMAGSQDMRELLNGCGYYVAFGSDAPWRPDILAAEHPERHRYRLIQLNLPSDELTVYSDAGNGWFTDFLPAGEVSDTEAEWNIPVAENIIALAVLPRRNTRETEEEGFLSPNYFYDTRLNAEDHPQPPTAHQLPPVVDVALVAIDEQSAQRLENGAQEPSVIRAAVEGRFANAEDFAEDLRAIEETLADEGIETRVFVASVPMRESKWDEQ